MNGHADHLVGTFVAVDRTLEQEFEARFVESATLAFRVAYAVLRHRQDAEDVAQESFVRAHRRFVRLRNRERFRAWLVRMTWRLAIDRQRGDRRRLTREERSTEHDAGGRGLMAAEEARAEQDLIARQRADHLWSAIDALPDKLRVTVVLANIEENDVEEVARLLALPVGTVKSRLFLARQKLKESLRWMQSSIR
ncbi:MAG TPA: sigma-70 family RNA polymerase sigma factor [Vicinamibacterales bacterium]|jgi:RNA polymerase sigma-70 factor (ECF subfamily)